MKKKFLLREDLNGLARLLRFLGYDAAVYKSISLSNAKRIAVKDKRMFLTRSSKDFRKSKDILALKIISTNKYEQLGELKGIIEFNDSDYLTICSVCNKKLVTVEKEKIKSLVPDFTFNKFDDFRYCRNCGRIYWMGSHMKDLISKIEEIKKK